MTTTPTGSSGSIIVSVAEEMNPTRRSTMEDCHVIHEPGTWGCHDPHMSMLGVYDGHGGRDIVDFLEDALTENLATELRHNVEDPADNVDIPTRIKRAFLITDIQSRMEGLMTSGATVAICLIKKEPNSNKIIIYAANAGDARAVISSTSDSLKAFRLTHDHRADDPTEIARIEKAGGFVLRNRVLGILTVARSLGDHGMKEFVIGHPYVSTTNLDFMSEGKEGSESARSSDTGEFVIVACDGLWDVIDDQDAVDLVRKSVLSAMCSSEADCIRRKKNVAQVLVDEALRRGSTDNITAIVSWL